MPSMPRSADSLTAAELGFLAERHLGTLTTLRPDGTPHVVAIAFTYEDGIVRIITNERSVKVRNVETGGRAAVSQVDGPRWLTLEGQATVSRDPERIAEAVDAFRRRYREPRPNPDRVAIEIHVDRVLGRVPA